MSRVPDQLTLDTNAVCAYWRAHDQTPMADKRGPVVEKLLDLASQGLVTLAVTARIRHDIPKDPKASRINELPEVGIAVTGSVTRLGQWALDRDGLADRRFEAYYAKACALLSERLPGRKPPDLRDWDHLQAHMLQGRDVFLTWDTEIVCLADKLKEESGLRAMSPEVYLRSREDRGSGEEAT